jgi:hypothetical protein
VVALSERFDSIAARDRLSKSAFLSAIILAAF